MKTYLWTLILIMFIPLRPTAQIDSIPVPKNDKERPKVGLVLSGGSAHGLAHIGVIQLLEELDIPVDYITGTSMGAIIGALNAMGQTSDEIRHLSDRMKWMDIINNRISLQDIAPSEKYHHDKFPFQLELTREGIQLPLGFVKSNKLDIELTSIYAPAYRVQEFKDLPTPFKCYTVDIASGEVIEQDHGNLSRAVRKSMSIPSLFPPVKEGNHLYVDGGLIRNFPAEQVKDMGADIVIGSYVGAKKYDLKELNSFIKIMRQAGTLLSFNDYNKQIKYVDVLITPDIKDYSSFDFDKANLFIDEGYIAALEHKEELERIKKVYHLERDQEKKKKPLQPISFLRIDSIATPHLRGKLRGLILDKLEIETGSYASLHRIEEGLKRITSTKSFYNTNYFIKEDNGKTILEIGSTAVRQANLVANINRFYTSETSFIIGAVLKNYMADLADFKIITRISEFPGMLLDFSKRGGIGTNNFVYSAGINAEREKFPLYYHGNRKALMDVVSISGGPTVEWEYSTALSLVGQYRIRYHVLDNTLDNSEALKFYKLFGQSLSGSIRYNTLNEHGIASSGIKAELELRNNYSVNNKYRYRDNAPRDDFSDVDGYWEASLDFRHILPVGKRSFIDYNTRIHLREDNTFTDIYRIGGTEQDKSQRLSFVGMREGEGLFGSHLYGRLGYSYHLNNGLAMSGIVNAVWGDDLLSSYYPELPSEDFIIGYGISMELDIPIGPLRLEIGSNQVSKKVVGSLSFGYRHIY